MPYLAAASSTSWDAQILSFSSTINCRFFCIASESMSTARDRSSLESLSTSDIEGCCLISSLDDSLCNIPAATARNMHDPFPRTCLIITGTGVAVSSDVAKYDPDRNQSSDSPLEMEGLDEAISECNSTTRSIIEAIDHRSKLLQMKLREDVRTNNLLIVGMNWSKERVTPKLITSVVNRLRNINRRSLTGRPIYAFD